MADQETLYVRRFEEGITLLQQQMPSVLEMAVSRAMDIGERKAFDQVESTEMDERFGRGTDTPISIPDHRKRWLHTRDFEKAFLFDKEDDLRVLNNPVNAYTQLFQAARNRKADDLIIEAYTATAVTGKDFSGSAAFPGGQFTIGDGGTNLTPDKIRQANRVLEDVNNMKDGGMFRWYFVASPQAKEHLLSENQVISVDFNTVKALMSGMINEWMGFEWKWSTRLPKTGDIRDCFAWVKNSMKFGLGGSPTTRVGERADKSFSTQVYRADHFGAVRMDEKGVMKVQIDETA